jgi:exopolysaccharide biosynthesis protein
MYMTNQVSNALDGVLAIEKIYWLNDHDLIAPEPNPNGYGKTTDPTSLQWLLDEASALLGIDEFVFSTDIKTIPGSEINYYLDETIFAITWRESIKNCAYTFAEVKIAHPSQFRRFLAGGTYGSDKQFVTTQMASDVNAVLASSGDFYKFRNFGTIVYDGVVKRINSNQVDTCFIDDKGDLIFTYRGEITKMEAAQKFVDENNIRFSIAFGPVLVDNGVRCEPNSYPIGEINDTYARAGLGQIGELHYLVVTANRWQVNNRTATIHDFAQVMLDKKCWKAYTLDGGQTGVIAMDGKMMNPAQYGAQRSISDIFYFATALPDGE